MFITIREMRQAQAILTGILEPTPLQYSKTFSGIAQNEIYMKPENLQKTGSFKIRGAYNNIANLSDEQRARGIIATSAGNHGQGAAYAAKLLNAKATVIMPEKHVKAKREAIEGYGATVIAYGKNSLEMHAKAEELIAAHGYTRCHAFDDPYTIAGQSTIGLEILEELPSVEAVVVQASGGGLISGIAAALKELKPTVHVVGVNAENSPAITVSLKQGEPTVVPKLFSIADGLGSIKPGISNFEYCKKYVDEWVLVSETEMRDTIRILGERAKLVVEGAGAAALAALLYKKTSLAGKKTAVILSGGNIDFDRLSKIYNNTLEV